MPHKAPPAHGVSGVVVIMPLAVAPDSYVCPLSRELMQDPVQTADGHTYERSWIESWLQVMRGPGAQSLPMPGRRTSTNFNRAN